jgi:hypothetical protein
MGGRVGVAAHGAFRLIGGLPQGADPPGGQHPVQLGEDLGGRSITGDLAVRLDAAGERRSNHRDPRRPGQVQAAAIVRVGIVAAEAVNLVAAPHGEAHRPGVPEVVDVLRDGFVLHRPAGPLQRLHQGGVHASSADPGGRMAGQPCGGGVRQPGRCGIGAGGALAGVVPDHLLVPSGSRTHCADVTDGREDERRASRRPLSASPRRCRRRPARRQASACCPCR